MMFKRSISSNTSGIYALRAAPGFWNGYEMSMSERELLKQAYPYPTWWAKVNKMSDAQVHAIFIQMRLKGKVA